VKAIVFLGPTLPHVEAADIFDAVYRGPAAQGDVLLAVRERPHAIGIVDGYFERIPAVWHKEVLWALASGINVFGAASMGALRAAELAAFGMHGVGRIFEAFRDGMLEDDDEVALAHGDESVSFRTLSEPMVNVRATLHEAAARGVLSEAEASAIVDRVKALFYPERSYDAVMRAAREHGFSVESVSLLADFLRDHAVNQKRLDAIAMLRAMRECCDAGTMPPKAKFCFARTEAWQAVVNRAGTDPRASCG
jgi:hypothetical protein